MSYILLVSGSRDAEKDLQFVTFVNDALDQHAATVRIPDLLIHGNARGVDRLCQQWARTHGIPDLPFDANDVLKYGPWPAAGPRRNRAMVDHAVALHNVNGDDVYFMAFPSTGHGTADCTKQARDVKLPGGYWTFTLTGAQFRPLTSYVHPSERIT